jgi:hypothetical protein
MISLHVCLKGNENINNLAKNISVSEHTNP